MITRVIVHLENDLPVLVDLEHLPQPGDRMLICTNVRTVDGKRPSFVNDRHGTFIFPLGIVRLIEVPTQVDQEAAAASDAPASEAEAAPSSELPPADDEAADEEPDQDLLARIRSI